MDIDEEYGDELRQYAQNAQDNHFSDSDSQNSEYSDQNSDASESILAPVQAPPPPAPQANPNAPAVPAPAPEHFPNKPMNLVSGPLELDEDFHNGWELITDVDPGNPDGLPPFEGSQEYYSKWEGPNGFFQCIV